MSECFADAAARLAGLVPRLLGWSPDAFWNATPAELAAILSPDPSDESLARTEFEALMERDAHG
jgi:hypothetical protein